MDIREEKIYLFRDRVGVKPLYYFDNSKEFAKLAEDFAKLVKHEMETNPYFNAEECCVWSCPYNSGYDHDV